MIQAKVIADSLTPKGERLTTLEVIMPRYILAEKNTHRVLTKNSASSRAIPFKKMLKSVMENPFIPYAFQKDHPGMQGTEYFDTDEKVGLPRFISILRNTLGYKNEQDADQEVFKIISEILKNNEGIQKTLPEWWLYCRDKAVKCAILMASLGITKQLANRLLEPFMYHKVLVSATEWENFFKLRCPNYKGKYNSWKSWKEMLKEAKETENDEIYMELANATNLYKLQNNTGQADIHMMFLAESIYDAMNESIPKELEEGQWHIPYGDDIDKIEDYKDIANKYNLSIIEIRQKISIARCARLSYQTLGDNPVIDYEADLKLYEVLSKSGHWSPFEHVAKVMTEIEYNNSIKGTIDTMANSELQQNFKAYTKGKTYVTGIINNKSLGWCRNYKGFIQYRELLDN